MGIARRLCPRAYTGGIRETWDSPARHIYISSINMHFGNNKSSTSSSVLPTSALGALTPSSPSISMAPTPRNQPDHLMVHRERGRRQGTHQNQGRQAHGCRHGRRHWHGPGPSGVHGTNGVGLPDCSDEAATRPSYTAPGRCLSHML
jgi:hypothetical protein